MTPLTHASFFSGVGGLDLGLERAGWSTLSVSEIEPYACAVLAERFPGRPNLGNINDIDPEDIPDATLWTGGFPCQDLSKAGQRRGFGGGDRSVLAFTFLDLVELRRPAWFILENVDGLLSSNDGRDLARLAGEVDRLGYGLAWRVLDAQWFGVAQRRRRVFLVASRGSDRAGAVLLDGDRGRGDPPACVAARKGFAGVAGLGADIGGAITRRYGKGVNTTIDDGAIVIAGTRTSRPLDDRGDIRGGLVVGAPPDPDGVRAAHGLAGRLDDRAVVEVAPTLQAPRTGGYRYDVDQASALIVTGLGSDGPGAASSSTAPALRSGGGGQGDTVPIAFVKRGRAQTAEAPKSWSDGEVAPTLNVFDVGDSRATVALVGHAAPGDDELLPLGLDTHRYRCVGNGVVANVAEWIGRRLAAELAEGTAC